MHTWGMGRPIAQCHQCQCRQCQSRQWQCRQLTFLSPSCRPPRTCAASPCSPPQSPYRLVQCCGTVKIAGLKLTFKNRLFEYVICTFFCSFLNSSKKSTFNFYLFTYLLQRLQLAPAASMSGTSASCALHMHINTCCIIHFYRSRTVAQIYHTLKYLFTHDPSLIPYHNCTQDWFFICHHARGT